MCDHLQKGYIQHPNMHECDTAADNCFSNSNLTPKRYAVIRALDLNYVCPVDYFRLGGNCTFYHRAVRTYMQKYGPPLKSPLYKCYLMTDCTGLIK